MSERTRTVKGLVLGETLGKGTFGYVKLGIKKSTKQQFALKFLLKKNSRFNEDAVRTEIECMKRVKHKNVIRLLAHDYNCKYPGKDGKIEDTVLMVLEYAPGGDLYDILFYSGKLNEQITKTYFLQLAEALKACHAAGVTHRDLKANNILLDHKFRLKITDFGLSHVYEGDNIANNRMKTTWVGTRGYQAPELILNRPFSYKVDIFSMGVVVFTLLCGHQPFKQAAATDPWFKCIAAGKPKKFWNAHSNDKMSKPCMNIIERMIAYQPKQRAEIPELYEHDWVAKSKEPPYSEEELFEVMKKLHRVATEKKMKDPKRLKRIQESQVKGESRAVLDPEQMQKLRNKFEVPNAPAVIPATNCFVLNEKEHPMDIILELRDTILHHKLGNCEWDAENFQLDGTITMAGDDADFTMGIQCRLFKHPEAEGRFLCTLQRDIGDANLEENLHAWDDIWMLASKNFEAPYYPTYDEALFTYDSAMFDAEEEVLAREE